MMSHLTVTFCRIPIRSRTSVFRKVRHLSLVVTLTSISVYFQMFDGETSTITVLRDSTVTSIKALMKEYKGYLPESYYLIPPLILGQTLNDTYSILNSHVCEGSTLFAHRSSKLTVEMNTGHRIIIDVDMSRDKIKDVKTKIMEALSDTASSTEPNAL